MISANVKFLDAINDEIYFSSVKSDYIDKEIFNDAMKDGNKLKQKINERNEKTPFFKKLSEDLFNALYKVAPHVYNKANVAASLKIENELLNMLINNDNFNKLRRNTACDLFNSTYALSMFLEKAEKIIDEWANDSKENKIIMEYTNTAITYQEQLRYVNDMLLYDSDDELLIKKQSDLKSLVDDSNSKISRLQKSMNIDDSNNKISRLQKSMNINDLNNRALNLQNTKNIDDYNMNVKSLGDPLVMVLKETTKKFQKDCTMLNVFFTLPKTPGSNNGNLQKVSYEEKIELAEILIKSNGMRNIANKLGKMQKFICSKGKNPGRYGCTITGITTGNNINRVLSSEKLLLSDNNLENIFYKKYFNKELFQYEVLGEDEIKGPVIVCIDNSESMKGNKDYFAKAAAIAMLNIAVIQKRPYKCIFFDNDVNCIFEFKKGEYDLKKVIELAKVFYGGGTEFEPPLKKAMKCIEEYKFRNADILFITDGEPVKFLSADFKKRLFDLKKRKKFIIQGIMIDEANHKYMREFCDYIVGFNDLIDEKVIENILCNI